MPPTSDQDITRRYFDAQSDYWRAIYDDAAPRTYSAYRLWEQHTFALEFVAQQRGVQHILELGCGAGLLAMDFARRGYQITAVDLAPNMIAQAREMARERALSVAWRVGAAETLPDADEAYDAIVALGLLANIPQLDLALSEMARVLRPGGMIAVTMPNGFALDVWVALPRSLSIMIWHPRYRRLSARAGNLWRWLRRIPRKDPQQVRHGRTMSSLGMVRTLQRAGFADVRLHALAYGPMMPLGLRIFSDETVISWSEALAARAHDRAWLGHLATTIVYTATKSP